MDALGIIVVAVFWLAIAALYWFAVEKPFKQANPCPPHRWLRQGDGLVCDKCARKPGSWF